SNSMAPLSFARLRLACTRSVLLRLASVRSAPERLAPRSTARWNDAPLRLAPARLAPARLRRLSWALARLQPGQSLVLPARKASTSCACAGLGAPPKTARPQIMTAAYARITPP